jgi:hypothetical protein
MEAEYISTSEVAKDACWLCMLLHGISVPIKIPTPILCDNAAQILAADQMLHAHTKHIDNCYHHIHDCIEKKKIFSLRVSSADNVADTLTKALPLPTFLRHCASLGLC